MMMLWDMVFGIQSTSFLLHSCLLSLIVMAVSVSGDKNELLGTDVWVWR